MTVVAADHRAAVRTDELSAAYVGTDVMRRERPGSARQSRATQVVVELRQAFGGMIMRALVGAEFSPNQQGSVTVFEVPFGGPLGLGAVAECASELGGPLVAGLPRDFAAALLDGLTGQDPDESLPSGLLRIHRAGFDEIGSSEMAFRLAGGLLRQVMNALLRDDDPLAAAQTVLKKMVTYKYYSRTFTLCDDQGCGEAQSVGGMSDLIPALAVVDDRQSDHPSHDVGSAAVVLVTVHMILWPVRPSSAVPEGVCGVGAA